MSISRHRLPEKQAGKCLIWELRGLFDMIGGEVGLRLSTDSHDGQLTSREKETEERERERERGNYNNKKHHSIYMTGISPKSKEKKSPHKITLIISPSQFFNKLYQIGFQPSAMSKRIHKCSRQSLCLGWPLLVHADEGGESQDQVPAGQRDACTSCAPIGCSVGRCGQETREVLISCDCTFTLPDPPFANPRSA